MLSKNHHQVDLPSNPLVFGPGIWISIHIMAYNSITKNEQEIFCKQVRNIVSSLTCHECRKHGSNYILNNSPENYIDDKNNKAMFKWSCDFHNSVNKLTGKEEVKWEDMYLKYVNNAPLCQGNCITPIPPLKNIKGSMASFNGNKIRYGGLGVNKFTIKKLY